MGTFWHLWNGWARRLGGAARRRGQAGSRAAVEWVGEVAQTCTRRAPAQHGGSGRLGWRPGGLREIWGDTGRYGEMAPWRIEQR